MRGPQVFCLNPARQKPEAPTTGGNPRWITLDPAALGDTLADDEVRPGGIAVEVPAWSCGHVHSRVPDSLLELTEFPDPGGEAVFFRVPNPRETCLTDDELSG